MAFKSASVFLAGGGKSETAADYSSDSESDTEDYVHSKPRYDVIQGHVILR